MGEKIPGRTNQSSRPVKNKWAEWCFGALCILLGIEFPWNKFLQLSRLGAITTLLQQSHFKFIFTDEVFFLSQLLLSEQDCLLKPSKNDKSKRLFDLQPQSLTSKPKLLLLILCPTPLLSLTKQPPPVCSNNAPLNLTQSGSRGPRCSGMQQLSSFILTTALSLGERRKCSYLRKGRLQVADQTCLGSRKDIMIPVWQGYGLRSIATVGRVHDAFWALSGIRLLRGMRINVCVCSFIPIPLHQFRAPFFVHHNLEWVSDNITPSL